MHGFLVGGLAGRDRGLGAGGLRHRLGGIDRGRGAGIELVLGQRRCRALRGGGAPRQRHAGLITAGVDVIGRDVADQAQQGRSQVVLGCIHIICGGLDCTAVGSEQIELPARIEAGLELVEAGGADAVRQPGAGGAALVGRCRFGAGDLRKQRSDGLPSRRPRLADARLRGRNVQIALHRFIDQAIEQRIVHAAPPPCQHRRGLGPSAGVAAPARGQRDRRAPVVGPDGATGQQQEDSKQHKGGIRMSNGFHHDPAESISLIAVPARPWRSAARTAPAACPCCPRRSGGSPRNPAEMSDCRPCARHRGTSA